MKRDDTAAVNPVPSLVIVTAGLILITAIYGDTLTDLSFPTWVTPNADACDGGLLNTFFCGFSYFTSFLANVFLAIYGGILYLVNGISFNVPGAPWYARVMIASILGGNLTISILGFFRGN